MATTESDADSIHALVQCHCKSTSVSLSIPSSCFPLKSALCHCTSCRRSSGHVFTTWAVIPLELPEALSPSNTSFIRYDSSATLARFSCRTCGASLFNIDSAASPPEWEVARGCLQFPGESKGLEGRLARVQLWADDVYVDGGALPWVNAGKLEGMDRHRRDRGSEQVGDAEVQTLKARAAELAAAPLGTEGKKLRARCHCGRVEFELARAEGEGKNKGLFSACLCPCTSCCVTSGCEITAWASVPWRYVADLEEMTTKPETRGLVHYKSSEKVDRWFCGGCGATVFYQGQGRDSVDVGIGLLEGGDGVGRLGDWLLWDRALGFTEDAEDAEFVAKLNEGIKEDLGDLKVLYG